MKRSFVSALIIGGLMVMSAAGARYLTPTNPMWETRSSETLEQMIPTRFGDWTEEKIPSTTVVDPQIQEKLRAIYTQIVTRTYVNSQGQRIMLSVAYGKDQSDQTQVHYPEVCYPAQGFRVTENEVGKITVPGGEVLVRRLQTNFQQQRYEPVTYWSTVGNRVVTGKFEKKVAQLDYSLEGVIPDGLLFRVSSIDTDTQRAFRTQEEFVQSMVPMLTPVAKVRLMGLAAR